MRSEAKIPVLEGKSPPVKDLLFSGSFCMLFYIVFICIMYGLLGTFSSQK